ncbi:PA domain-containing protein [Fluviicola taffensis]|uniref:Protease-associated PA domain protein n=1 Tax=Fluviicola taffensis (strain DSM 16823 / NCIMB 13979 / RW262) TaxID=755732 RepID=F2IEG4_FLUTR|nr:PA domain-containing protein [Fluviicola taffensis]AEA43488.1 protease-associated PA domain protein [Fluviicola taffensis DSM 16823]
MKKLLLSLALGLVGSSAMSQVIFSVEAPVAIEGFYDFSTTGTGWGLPNLNGYLLIDTVKLADDLTTNGVNAQGNPASATGCNTLPANSLAGKVALVFRGDGGTPGIGACEFGTKALKCQQAGAVAVIIVNRDATTLAMSPGSQTPTTDGSLVTIPVIMINLAAGQGILNQLTNNVPVVVLIGDKSGYYGDDVTTFDNNCVRARFGSKPVALTQNASEFSLNPGTWVYNNGSNDQTNVLLTTTIKRNGTSIYTEVSTPRDIISGDSVFMTTPTFSSASYAVGNYELTYSLALTGTDEFLGDNTSTNYFSISDSLWSLVRLDAAPGKVVAKDGFYRATTPPTGTFETCITLKDPNASRVAMDGVYFGGLVPGTASEDTLITLDGFEVSWSLYTWNDNNKTIASGTFSAINEVANGTYNYPEPADALEEATVFIPINNGPYRFLNNQDYLLCISSYIPKLYMAFSTEDYYDYAIKADNLIRFPFRNNSTTWTPQGFSISASIAIRTGATLSVDENELVNASAFPVPAKEVITVKVKAAGDATLKIVDMAGRLVSTQAVTIENGEFQTSVEGMNSGSYVFTLDYSNGTTSRFNVVVSK